MRNGLVVALPDFKEKVHPVVKTLSMLSPLAQSVLTVPRYLNPIGNDTVPSGAAGIISPMAPNLG